VKSGISEDAVPVSGNVSRSVAIPVVSAAGLSFFEQDAVDVIRQRKITAINSFFTVRYLVSRFQYLTNCTIKLYIFQVLPPNNNL